jgi:hypothetical protein
VTSDTDKELRGTALPFTTGGSSLDRHSVIDHFMDSLTPSDLARLAGQGLDEAGDVVDIYVRVCACVHIYIYMYII